MKANKQSITKDDKAQMQMVGAAIGLFITIIVCILIYYNISASTIQTAAKSGVGLKNQAINASINATNQINNQAATFFTIAPIIGIVIVAVVVIGYVKTIG